MRSFLAGASLRHHWRAHLGVVLGTATATAVLVGALSCERRKGSSFRANVPHSSILACRGIIGSETMSSSSTSAASRSPSPAR